ncbi:MAG: YHYH protein [Luteolibacter sp.]
MKTLPASIVFGITVLAARADPQLTSWITAYSSKYARIHRTDAEKLAGTTYTTWTNTRNIQSLPAYCGIQSITYSSSWIYFNTSDLAPYTMGPWYDNAARTTEFVNLPVNQNLNYRIPRTSSLSTPPTTKTNTKGMEDSIGFYVDGVSMFDPTDGFTYSGGTEASPGTGQWHRDAYFNEGITFDPGNTHQQNTGKYHNHANPIALRYLLGDHVDFNSATKTYSESTATPTKHSPIIGWMRDGYPVYGPNGYSSPLDANSGIRRMVGGYVKRDGTTTGVDNITTTGRSLPTWATRNNGGTSATGPTVSTTYPLGRYNEDWAYLGDLYKVGSTKYAQGTDFDLNEYNVRYCVTPEFPGGTYAYFLCLDASGAPQFPYNSTLYFFGNPTGGTATAAETVTSYFSTGGANLVETAAAPVANSANGNVTLTLTSVEGGTYKVDASDDLAAWTTLTSTQAATSASTTTSYVEAGAVSAHPKRFYRVSRAALASYDGGTGTGTGGGTSTEGISTVSPSSGTRGTQVTLTVTLNSSYNPAPPPTNVAPTSATLTKTGATIINATSYTRNSTTGVVTLVFTIPANATAGAYSVNATFGPNTWSLTNGFTVN